MTDDGLSGAAYTHLRGVEPRFGEVIDRLGHVDPFEWSIAGRTGDNFSAMALHITSQQIATKVAFAIYDRVAALAGGTVTAEAIAALGVEQLRAAGMSTSKARYIHSLAEAQLEGRIDLGGMDGLDDADATALLVAQPGIGEWTAEMFLIFQLHRADVLPAADVGIRRGIQKTWELDGPPSVQETLRRGEPWRPYRTFAAALLWRSLA
jgi:DNA-3-methyladenine glycosylase II